MYASVNISKMRQEVIKALARKIREWPWTVDYNDFIAECSTRNILSWEGIVKDLCRYTGYLLIPVDDKGKISYVTRRLTRCWVWPPQHPELAERAKEYEMAHVKTRIQRADLHEKAYTVQ